MPNTRENLIELLKSGGVRDFPFNAALADHLIANCVAVQQWISITERLPGANEKVLICSLIGNQYVAQHLRGHFYVDGCNIGASHWMPLPQPPKGD